jgi:hypothetical protein
MSALYSQLPFGGGVSIALPPVDLAAAAANTLYAKVRDINDFLWLIWYLGAGTAGDEATLSLQQATNASGGSAKTLPITEVWFKRGGPTFATNPATNDLWTKNATISRETPANTYATAANRVAATNHFMAAIRISPKDLDMGNGFGWVRGGCTDVGANAQLGFAFWVPEGIAYQGSSFPSILAP